MVDFENILILGINEKESTISLKLSLSLWWKEPRLTISSNATKDEIDCLNTARCEVSLYLRFSCVYHNNSQQESTNVSSCRAFSKQLSLSRYDAAHIITNFSCAKATIPMQPYCLSPQDFVYKASTDDRCDIHVYMTVLAS